MTPSPANPLAYTVGDGSPRSAPRTVGSAARPPARPAGDALAVKEPESPERAGPWLDRLFQIRLASGRFVSVAEVTLLPTNVGVLEGGLAARWNELQRAQLVALARQRHGEPVVVVEPAIIPLPEISTPQHPRERHPWLTCMARLTSAPLVEDGRRLSSELTLLWWQDRLDLPLAAEVERAAAALDWERSARDVEFW